MKKVRELGNIDLKNYKRFHEGINHDVCLMIHGIFDTIELNWIYYLNSIITIDKLLYQTSDISNNVAGVANLTQASVTRGIKFETIEEALEFANSFKTKWESGRNITKAEIRDKKISQITDEE